MAPRRCRWCDWGRLRLPAQIVRWINGSNTLTGSVEQWPTGVRCTCKFKTPSTASAPGHCTRRALSTRTVVFSFSIAHYRSIRKLFLLANFRFPTPPFPLSLTLRSFFSCLHKLTPTRGNTFFCFCEDR